MADRPILFSTPMVQALHAGRKFQTRRVLKGAPEGDGWFCDHVDGAFRFVAEGGAPSMPCRIPYAVGDRLWCREAWRTFVSLDEVPPRDIWSPEQDRGAGIAYEAGGGMSIAKGAGRERHYGDRDDLERFGRLRPGMFMPRWASRAFVTVTDVRVQRLQEISDVDAVAEGMTPLSSGRYFCGHDEEGEITCKSAITAYANLWNRLHHDEGAWTLNPWLGVYTFAVTLRNIDEAA
jgi:hypothetical protein